MGKFLIILFLTSKSVFGFWPFDWFDSKDPLPAYVLEHPLVNEEYIYGVGNGRNFLEAKSKALNDIATQVESNVRSITSVNKNTATGSSADQQITVLTKRLIENYEITDETHANGTTYLLIRYKRR